MEAAATSTEGAAPLGMGVRFTRGLGWKFASQIVDQGSRAAMVVILARLLTPEQYGVAGMALIFSGLALIFTDLSLGGALVQRATITQRDRSTTFWTTTAAGLLVTLLAFFGAPLVAKLFGEPQVQTLFRAVAITFCLSAMSATQVALLTRDMNFRGLELREMCGGLTRAITAIACAAAGLGAWSIIAGAIAASIVSLVALWTASAWRPSFEYSLASLRDLGSYGANMFGSRLLGYMTENADNLLVGRFLGSAALGVYSIAYNAMLVPLMRIAWPVQQVLFPALSRIQHDRKQAATLWLRTVTGTTALIMPIVVGITVIAPEAVSTVLGNRWMSVAPILRLLCIGALGYTLQKLNVGVLSSQRSPRAMFWFSVLTTTASVCGFVIGLRWGLTGVAASTAIVRIVLLPLNAYLACRVLDVSLRRYFRSWRGVLYATGVMAVSIVGTRAWLESIGAGPALRLAVIVPLGAAIFVAALAVFERGFASQVRQALLERRRVSPI
jgi:O-antigen/teichoic acid export membrane protein